MNKRKRPSSPYQFHSQEDIKYYSPDGFGYIIYLTGSL